MDAWYVQQTDHTCGPAAVRSAMGALCMPVPGEGTLARMCRTDAQGTRPRRLAEACGPLGLQGMHRTGWSTEDLRRALAAGWVPIVLVALPDEGVDHYVTVQDVRARNVVLGDPWRGDRHRLDRTAFDAQWRDTRGERSHWGLLVRPSPLSGAAPSVA